MTSSLIATTERETIVLRRLVRGQPVWHPMHLSGHPAEDGTTVIARSAWTADGRQITHLIASYSPMADAVGEFRWVVNDWQFRPDRPRTLWLAPHDELGIEEVWREDELETSRLHATAHGAAETAGDAAWQRQGA